MKMVPMFTYGILKYPENITIEGGINIIENAMIKGHKMYAYRGYSFPVTQVTGNESDVVYGTYFEIYEQMVTEGYDAVEGYSPSNPPHLNMYNRRMVEVILPSGEKKMANMYIANEGMFGESLIPDYNIITGNFDDRWTHTRQIIDYNNNKDKPWDVPFKDYIALELQWKQGKLTDADFTEALAKLEERLQSNK